MEEIKNKRDDKSDTNENENSRPEKIDKDYRDNANNKVYIRYNEINDKKDDIDNEFAKIT